MGYILDLRKELGSRPLIMAGAGVILLNEKTRYFSAGAPTTTTGTIPQAQWRLEKALRSVLAEKYLKKQD